MTAVSTMTADLRLELLVTLRMDPRQFLTCLQLITAAMSENAALRDITAQVEASTNNLAEAVAAASSPAPAVPPAP
jgi:hypothetical protein